VLLREAQQAMVAASFAADEASFAAHERSSNKREYSDKVT
jgi:hypothetical protein